jgi:DNA repair exonuclease SbcCD nuclease subunit
MPRGAALPGQSGEGFEHAWDRDFQIPKRLLQHPRVSFIGLGHIHERQSLDHDMWYAGSSTILNSAEADSRKGALVVEIPHAGFGRVTPVDLPHTPIKVFRVRASDLETLLGRLTAEERDETYVKFVVTMDGSLTRKSVRALIGKTVRRYFGIEIIEPREVEAAAARLQRPAGARLNAHDLGGTLRAHITEQHRDDPDLEALLALAESCLEEAKARGDWSHQGGSRPTGEQAPEDTTAPADGPQAPPTLTALFDSVTTYTDATDLVAIDLS